MTSEEFAKQFKVGATVKISNTYKEEGWYVDGLFKIASVTHFVAILSPNPFRDDSPEIHLSLLTKVSLFELFYDNETFNL